MSIARPGMVFGQVAPHCLNFGSRAARKCGQRFKLVETLTSLSDSPNIFIYQVFYSWIYCLFIILCVYFKVAVEE